MLRSQAGVESAFITALIVVLLVTIVVPGIREAELDTSLSSARLAGVNWAAANESREFTGLGFSRQPGQIMLEPYGFEEGQSDWPSKQLKSALLGAIRDTVAPAQQITPEGCVQGVNYEYCFESFG